MLHFSSQQPLGVSPSEFKPLASHINALQGTRGLSLPAAQPDSYRGSLTTHREYEARFSTPQGKHFMVTLDEEGRILHSLEETWDGFEPRNPASVRSDANAFIRALNRAKNQPNQVAPVQ